MVLPLIIAGAVLGSLIIAGCSGSKEEDVPGGAPFMLPEGGTAEPRSDAFSKSPEEMPIDDRSFATLNYLWTDDAARSHISMWEPRSRLYIGAASDLLRPIYEEDEDLGPEVKAYRDSVAYFLQQHYLKSDEVRGLPLEHSILVLIGGLAPVSLDQQVVFGALDALVQSSGAGEDFAKVLKAGYHFNAARMPSDAGVGVEGVSSAAGHMASAFALLEKVNEDALDDRQIEYLLALKKEMGSKEIFTQEIIETQPTEKPGKKKQVKKTAKNSNKKPEITESWGKKGNVWE